MCKAGMSVSKLQSCNLETNMPALLLSQKKKIFFVDLQKKSYLTARILLLHTLNTSRHQVLVPLIFDTLTHIVAGTLGVVVSHLASYMDDPGCKSWFSIVQGG